MDKSIQDKNDQSGDARKNTVNRSDIDGWDENKTIGELMREMNIPQAGTAISGADQANMPDPGKADPAVIIDETKKGGVDSKRRTMIKESKEDESGKDIEEIKPGKRNFELLINSLRKLVNYLREREDGKLNAIVPDGVAGTIMQGTNAIDKLLGEDKLDFAELNAGIMKIVSAVETIGSPRRQGGVREDTENLLRIKIALGQIELGCHDVIIRTAKDGSPEIKTTMISIGKLFNIVQAEKIRVAKLIADFDGFHRR
ncbi:MAG: hypothetical protein WC788_05930 [Candidatus Paceibacterota bacterium]|jgi:hypothetical protein